MPDESNKGTRYYGLNNYILRYSSIIPLTTRELYNRVSNEYGFIELRTFYRRLQQLAQRGHLKESISEYEIDAKSFYDTKCYAYRIKKKKHPIFQKQYIENLRKRVSLIRAL
jgi:Fe2+ or Zn2+ uptake regulation protein